MTSRFSILLVAAVLVASACTTEKSSATTDRAQRLETAPPGETETLEERRIANEREREAKREYKTPVGPTPVSIDMEAAREYKKVDPAGLPQTEQEKLEEVTVPVLLPAERELLAETLITFGDLWYAAGIDGDGVSIHIQGTRGKFDVPDAKYPKAAVEGRNDFVLTRTHGIVSVSFSAFGAAYSVDVECEAPMEDSRCTEDAYALQLAESLGVAGGVR